MHLRGVKSYRNRRDISPRSSKRLLRFESESVDFLADNFLEDNYEVRGGALSSRKRMELFLRCISDPGFQSGVASDVGVERSTVCKTLSSVLDSIVEKANNWIKFPSTAEHMNKAKDDWNSIFHIPTVIGAIDCSHVNILKPHVYGDEYVNRRNDISLNVQVTCDSREYITSVDAQWPGSVHDARIWRQSGIQDVMRRFNGDFCLLGDSGYGITPWLLTPYDNVITPQQRQFNYVHAQERVIIERVFGQLKRRFPILGGTVRLKLERVPKLIIACAVLHNVAKHLNDGWDYEELPGCDEENEYVEEFLDRNALRIRRLGQQKRDQIANRL